MTSAVLLYIFSSIYVGLNVLDIALAQFAGCDYKININKDVSHSINSPLYANYYKPNTNCRWDVTAPAGYSVHLNCVDISLPSSTNCVNDKLQVSKGGLISLADAVNYCGTGKTAVESTSNRIVIALRSGTSSKGGKFKCTLTSKLLPVSCNCGKRRMTKIVGGTEVLINEFPMMAGLVNIKDRLVYCGGTIIATAYALTAAHCLSGKTASGIALLVGDHDTTTGADTPYAALYTISKIIIHSGYNTLTKVNDIGLVRTTNTIAYNPGVGPACLPFRYTNTVFAGARVDAVGWGTMEFGGPISSRLRKVKLDVISLQLCQSQMSNVGATQICTFTTNKDACQSDSGGALFYTDPSNNLAYNIGIISYGIGCATKSPGVNTNVISYLNWITANTKDVGYCAI